MFGLRKIDESLLLLWGSLRITVLEEKRILLIAGD
ncbi:hypothetical protein SJDPG12_06660 [Porphyromonas gingivalis SJD12]|nr:hypothetical protein SJDPG12_06660 [Porphyromonas gingivalis SJD12]